MYFLSRVFQIDRNKFFNFFKGKFLSDKEIYKRDINWVKMSDVLVAEVTHPSFGVGIEIARATEFKKKVICIYRKIEGRKLSAMISGCPGILVFEYQELNPFS